MKLKPTDISINSTCSMQNFAKHFSYPRGVRIRVEQHHSHLISGKCFELENDQTPQSEHNGMTRWLLPHNTTTLRSNHFATIGQYP